MKQYRITYDDNYNGLPIQNGINLGCHGEILEALYNQMVLSLQEFGRTLFIRFDLRFPQFEYTPVSDNSTISSFIDSFINKHLINSHKVPARYLWVREQKRGAQSHHYHVLLLVSANALNNYRVDKLCVCDGLKPSPFNKLLRNAQYYWDMALCVPVGEFYGLVNFCNKDRYGQSQRNGITMYQNNGQKFVECFHWASYMAKCRTKGCAGSYREYGQSGLGGRVVGSHPPIGSPSPAMADTQLEVCDAEGWNGMLF